MRNETSTEIPELFTPENVVAESPIGNHAREFVRWCFSVGDGFRNSPDYTNFQTWLKKSSTRISKTEESEVLAEARRMFSKKVEQHVRRAGAASAGSAATGSAAAPE